MFSLDGRRVTLESVLADNAHDPDALLEIRAAFARARREGAAWIGGGAGASFLVSYLPNLSENDARCAIDFYRYAPRHPLTGEVIGESKTYARATIARHLRRLRARLRVLTND